MTVRKPINLEKGRIQKPTNKIEEVKAELCCLICKIASKESWQGKHLATRLGVSRTTVSRIYRHRFDEISLNQLFEYLANLKPGFRLLISI